MRIHPSPQEGSHETRCVLLENPAAGTGLAPWSSALKECQENRAKLWSLALVSCPPLAPPVPAQTPTRPFTKPFNDSKHIFLV